MDCPLCDAQNQTYRFITENEEAFCIVPLCHLLPGHIMVLPKRHVTNLADLTPTEARDVLTLTEQMKCVLKRAYQPDIIIQMNTGKHSTQPHLHFNLLPSEGGLRETVGEYHKVPLRKEHTQAIMQEMRDLIVSHL